jgi:ABC-type Fe3+/spermidine/putrescine transport system ATPase subunit
MPTSATGTAWGERGTARSSARAEALRLHGLCCLLGGRRVLDGLDLALEQGTFFALLGPSGCGKTTLLRVVGGYLSPAAGRVVIAGADVTAEPPERRDVGMVFQSYALFPHLTARDNVAFGLQMRRVPRAERNRRVDAMLDRVGLSPAERQRKPAQLSGGQQQRVALARALVIEPRLLLLDEPLANLDRRLREQLRGELRELQRRAGVTTLLVTHDQEEALALADRVGVLHQGRLLQTASPRDLYDHPGCPFVACFLGDANLLSVERLEGEAMVLQGGWSVPSAAGAAPGCRVLVRPEQVIVRPPDDPAGALAGVVDRTFLGADLLLTVALTEAVRLRVRCRPDGATGMDAGATVRLSLAGPPWVIPAEGP